MRRRLHSRPFAPTAALVVALLTAAALASLGGCGRTAEKPIDPPVVVDVLDGDTIVIDFGTVSERVRLLGIDTPESVDPNRPVQCFGAEATAHLQELLPVGTTVLVERDVDARDRYGRLLAYVFRSDDDLFVNAALLRGGFADMAILPPNTSYRDELEAAFARARTEDAGLWAHCDGPDQPLDPPAVDQAADHSSASNSGTSSSSHR